MSIIYDALKKVEAIRSQAPEVQIEKPAKFKFKPHLIYLLIGCFGLLMANMLYRTLTKPSQQYTRNIAPVLVEDKSRIEESPDVYTYQEPSPAITALEPRLTTPPADEEVYTPLPSLVLNGVFFSEEGAYALINNRIVRKGDIIDGLKVTQITLDGVELEFEGSTTKLPCARY